MMMGGSQTVTPAQVLAAQLLVELKHEDGDFVDEALSAVAEAEPSAQADDSERSATVASGQSDPSEEVLERIHKTVTALRGMEREVPGVNQDALLRYERAMRDYRARQILAEIPNVHELSEYSKLAGRVMGQLGDLLDEDAKSVESSGAAESPTPQGMGTSVD